METPDWIERGACWKQPHLTHLFFSDDPTEQRQAKALCFSCPVASQCLAGAMDRGEKFGIWGGMSPADRRRYKAERAL